MLELALAWPIKNDAVGCVIAGATKESQIAGSAAGIRRKLTPEIYEKLNVATEDLKQAMGKNADLWQGGENGRIM